MMSYGPGPLWAYLQPKSFWQVKNTLATCVLQQSHTAAYSRACDLRPDFHSLLLCA